MELWPLVTRCEYLVASRHVRSEYYAGVNVALFAPVVFGPPLVFAIDHRLRPPGTRSAGASRTARARGLTIVVR
ncbi:MAG TPA: hypothetical protein VFZ89_10800 [Solirubrobacteraceae bacterium]